MHLKTFLGYFMAGFCAMYLWPKVTEVLNIGIFGNWVAAIIVVGPLWYINHYLGLIKHHEDSAFVDMAFGIGIAGIFKGLFMGAGFEGLLASLPSLIIVILGGAFGGLMAIIVEKRWIKS